MIDLHTHLLPGLDDGVRSFARAVQSMRQAQADGVEAIVVTPHQRPGLFDVATADILDGIHTLKSHLDEASLNFPIHPGAEVHIQEDLVEKVKNGELLTLNETGRFILLELPYVHIPKRLEDLIFGLKTEDIHPIIAHPERNHGFRQHPDRLYELIRLGAYSQVTAASLIARRDSELASYCLNLIRCHLCHVIASDSHGHGKRAKYFPEAKAVVTEHFSEHIADQLMMSNPRKIIQGEDLVVESPEPWRSRSRFFGLLKP